MMVAGRTNARGKVVAGRNVDTRLYGIKLGAGVYRTEPDHN
jgi:hypothetical protein